MDGFGFPKIGRLRKRREFLSVQQSGKAHHGRYVVLVCAAGLGRVGITVSKRVGNAVVRNRVKRRVREILRQDVLGSLSTQDRDIVVVAKSPSALATLPAMREEILGLWKRAA